MSLKVLRTLAWPFLAIAVTRPCYYIRRATANSCKYLMRRTLFMDQARIDLPYLVSNRCRTLHVALLV